MFGIFLGIGFVFSFVVVFYVCIVNVFFFGVVIGFWEGDGGGLK